LIFYSTAVLEEVAVRMSITRLTTQGKCRFGPVGERDAPKSGSGKRVDRLSPSVQFAVEQTGGISRHDAAMSADVHRRGVADSHAT
jgi:hypothetical protein